MASSWGVSWGKAWGNSWGAVSPPPTPAVEFPYGGPGGSNKAGKKIRRGHAVSAIQSGAYLAAFPILDVLPDDTLAQEAISDYVEELVVEQGLQIKNLEQLIEVVNQALNELKDSSIRREQAVRYKEAVANNYKRMKRRWEEEVLLQLLMI